MADWIPGIQITAAFLWFVVFSIRQIVTTCRQWRHLARRYPLGSRTPPQRQCRVWRAHLGSLWRPFQHLRLTGNERGVDLIPSPLTRAIGLGPLYLPRDRISVRAIRRLGMNVVELAPTDTSCSVLWISRRAWRKSGLSAPAA